MTELAGIAGSLRQHSFNRALLASAAELMPAGASLRILDISGVPLYHGDEEEAHGVPDAVTDIKQAVTEASGLIIATPEYNGGMPGVLKNTIDWMSRPIADQPKVLHGKPVALMGATPGGSGTAHAQNAWLPVLRALRMPLWYGGGAFNVGQAHEVVRDGRLADEALRERLRRYLAAFVDYLSAR